MLFRKVRYLERRALEEGGLFRKECYSEGRILRESLLCSEAMDLSPAALRRFAQSESGRSCLRVRSKPPTAVGRVGLEV